jgi:hypothetical protein
LFAWNRCERRFGPLIAERLAGSLSGRDGAALEHHLRSCDACRTWEADMRHLAEGMRRASKGSALAHPTPAALAALSVGGGGLSGEERADLERHLRECADCRAEWNVATRWAPEPLPARASPVQTGRWSWFTAGALTAAAAAAVAFAVLLPPAPPPARDVRSALEAAGAPVQVRGAHHRAAGDATRLPVRPGVQVVVVGLTVEAPPGTPVELEMIDGNGRRLASAEVSLDDRSGLLSFSVPTGLLPEGHGEFRVRVTATSESFRYPFRVERGDD